MQSQSSVIKGDYFLQKAGKERILNIRCAECNETSNIANPVCFECVAAALKMEPADAVSMNKDFKKILSNSQTKMLTDAGSVISRIIGDHNYFSFTACEKCKKDRVKSIERIRNTLRGDPVKAYHFALQEQSHEKCLEACDKSYSALLEKFAIDLEKANLVKEASGEETYSKLFQPNILPAFISSKIDMNIPAGAKLVAQYNNKDSKISIYDIPTRPEKLYVVEAPEFAIHEHENKVLEDILEKISREESKVLDPNKARQHFKALGQRLLLQHSSKLSEKEIDRLAEIVARYSAGYGVLEVLLSDSKLQDIYIDSPGTTPLHVYHEDFEECITNITPTNFELEKLAARLRAQSGRPFDESSPVLHAEITDLGVRVCGLCPPATFSGFGFAFRRHRPTPWTLPQFISAGMMDATAAGILSFLVDGQRSILVTGPRGSGKTSLLCALLTEIPLNFRLIVIEDTPELPIEMMQDVGYKIQHIRTQPAMGGVAKESFELTSEEALRTALRLGESVLVIGEVRGPEARSLFEAMRIGAAGNVVMGTIHGSSAYDTWDRIVNDLDVPTTSFKATDIVVSAAAVRKSDEVRRYRRLMAVTEVKKHWKEDPSREEGFFDVIKYNPIKDTWFVAEGWEKSDVIKDVANLKGMKVEEAIKNIKARSQIKQLFVKYGKENSQLMEIGAVAKGNNYYLHIINQELKDSANIDYDKVVKEMETWLKKQAHEK